MSRPWLAGLIVACCAGAAAAAEPKQAAATEAAQRGGTCEQAMEQQKYWCEERAKVTVIQTGLECENAKRNVAEACQGEKTKDNVYK